MSKFLKLVSVLLLVVFSTIFVSCLQIGLGEQVDTASPTVAIKYPQTNSIIKGEFLLSGTCADDLGVESISVSIEDTKKKATLGTYDAVIDSSKGTWSIILNSKENDSYPLPDSLNYEITVTATDKSKHETTDKRAFIIDNTAPVLILSSPAKIGSESPTTYGRTLKLAGDISDDNTVSSLDLYLKQYDSSTETLSEEKHITVSNFTGMSSDNPLVVAKYYTEDEVENDSTKTTLRNNYLSIYGNVKDDDNTDEILYCRIVLTDNAKSYIASDDSGTGTGNATSLYYINNDNFANNLISEQSYSLTASKLKDIIKGEDAGYSDTELAAIKKLLATSGYYVSSTTIDSAASSVISMNPDNNPTYAVSNYELSGSLQSSVYKNFTAGSTLYLSLAAGRDKKYVVPSSVSAKLYKLSSATDNDISDTAENDIIVLLNKGDWTDEAALTCDKTFVLSTTNYPQLQKLSQCYFKLVVTGMDRDSTALEPANENGYGFKLTITGNPPILETGKRADAESLENVKDSEYIKSSALKFSGSVSSETNTIKSVTYEVTVKDEDISDEASSTISTYKGSAVCGDGTFDGMEETWSLSLADNESYKEIESGKVYTYTVKIIATDDNSSTTTESRRIHVDTKVPVVEITNVSPLAGTNSTCVNGTIAIEGSISESYKSTAVLTITDGSKTESVKSGAVDSFKTTVDTTSYTDKATLTLTLTATDKAGNTSEVYTKKYTIDQSTDAPVITLSNADITLQDSAKITAGKNLFSTTNSNLLGSITDDDGISSVEITYSTTADGEYTSLFKNTEIGGSTTYTITSTTGISFKNLTDGLYYVKLVVTDKAQEKTGYCNTNTDYFVVARDEGAPIFSITSTKNAYQAVGQSFTVSGKVKDSGGNIKIYSSADATYDSEDTFISTIANKTDEQDWSATIAIPSETAQGATLYYIAIDSYGQTSIDDFPYKVDPAAPTFTITQLGSNTTSADMPTKEKSFTSYAQKSSLFIVKGLVDDEGDSGLEDVIYYMVSSTEPAKITGDAAYDTTKGTWNKSTILRQSDVNHWTANLDFSSYDEGISYTVYLAARDNARNISLLADNPSNKIILIPDGTAPVVGSAVADDNKITNADINNNVKITASKITEGGSGIASVVLYENGSSIGAMTTSDSGATYTYSIPAKSTHLSTGSHTFAVRATDKVGNISADKTIVIAVDTTNPTANISTVTPLTSAGYANGNVTVYATAGDETELSAISWKVVAGTDVTKKEGTITVDANDKIYKSFTFALDTREITTGSGTYTLTVTSTDKAGNTTTTSGTTLNIDQATDVPVITLDLPATYEPGVTVGVGTNLFKSSDSMTGTITDDDGLASIVIKIDGTDTDTIEGGGAKTYALSKSLSALEEGTHTIEVTAKDNALGVSKTTNSFSVGIDNGAPTLTLSANVTTTKNNIYYANGDLTITAVVKDGYKLGSLEWTDTAVTPKTGSVIVAQNSTSQAKTITVAKPASNVKSTRTITAKDSFGRTTADTITYDFDVTPPTLTPAALTGVNTEGDLNYFNSSKTLTITGTASDGTATSNDSGLDSVYYAIVEGHYATPTDATTAGKTVTWNLTSGSATWSAKVDLIEKDDGNYTVFIKAVDFVRNEKISDAIKLVADKTSPAIAVTTINGVADTSVDTYYNKDTTIVGSLTEANLKQISVSSATCSDTAKTVTVANVSGVLTLSKLTDEGVWVITLSAEDKAGNKGSYTINTTVDKTSPAPVINETYKLGVGSKTFTSVNTSDSWFNQTSLQFIGYYKENGSGIEECSYFLNPATIPTESNVAGLTSNGTFSQASVTGDACKFNVTIANFLTDNSGLNKIYFAVKDKAGNYSISDAYVINVDQSTPTLTCSRTETLLTNCATTPEISGSCSDVGSGVASVVVKINGSEISSSVTDKTSWVADSTEITNALSGLLTSSYPVTADVTDNAGNSNTVSLFTLTVDKTAPTAAISASIPTSSLNGKKSLSGTVTEDNSPASFTLYYSTSNADAEAGSEGTIPSSWTKFGDEIKTASSIYNWSFTDKFDFSSLSGATSAVDGTATIYLLPVVYDVAGNCNVHADGKTTADFTQCSKKSVEYSVDQNTDRPVIKLSNLSISGSTLMSNTVIGTISDDDGISDFYYTDNSTSAATFDATDSNWKKITVTDGSWSIDAGDDGSKTWWFYVNDTEDGTFLTKSSSALTRAYISDSTTTKADNSSSLSFNVDTSSPVITSLAVYQATSEDVPLATSDKWTTTAGATFGGNNKYLFAKVVVTEAVGMASENPVTLSIGGNAVSATSSPSGTSPTYTYILGPVTVSTISGTGVMSLTVTATDNAKLSSSSAININIDNTAPTVNITSPGTTAADYVTSSATIKGIASDAGSSVGSIAWCVPTITQQADSSTIAAADWTPLVSTSTINISFAWEDISKYSDTTSSTGYATAASGNLVTIPVYFKTTDAAGNSAIDKTFAFYVNTDASKASAAITYPTDSAAVGSSVTLYGTASDDVSVSKVMVQLDVDGDGDFDEDDYTAISGWNVYGDNLVATTSDCEWYILATGTNSWKLSVDNSKINYTVESGKLRKLGVRVRAWDGLKNYDGTNHAEGSVHLRSWPTYTSDSTSNEIFVTIDAGAPEIKNLTLVQYSGETKVASVEYESGVYISGSDTTKTWYIEGTVTDDKALDSYSFNAVSGISVSGSKSGISNSGDTKSATIKKEITTSASGQIYTQLVATDTTGKSNQQYIIVNIDNIAPSIYNTSNDAVTSTTTSVRLKNSSSQTLGDSYVVENSDGSFTFGDTITEGESGLSYLAFYFGRKPLNGDNETRVYCPQYCLTTTGEAYDNKSTYSGSSGTDGSIYMNTDGLACMYVTGSTSVSGTTTTLTASKIAGNHNVRVGGLIKYNGVYKTITAVNWKDGTLTFTSSIEASTSATAELIYAQVVDHKGIEINDTYTNIENGDGDGMNEVLKVKGATYTWQASIASDNIPDGPIVIHVVAIDAAGNISKGTISTSIANNRPRIAKVLVATDLNGSGYFDYYNTESIKNANKDDDTASGSEFGEFVYYSTLDKATGKEQSLVTVSTSNPFVVKDKLLVLPEFVGGNGVLEYGYSIGDSDVTTPISGTTALASTASTLKVADKTGTTDNIADYIQATQVGSSNKYGGVVIEDNSAKTGLGKYESWTTSSKTEKYIALTFWDATEETTQGTNSLWAMLKIPAYINVVDDVEPKAKIEPFHWTSWSDCSTYVDSDGNSQGHIDLEADLGTTKPGVAGTVIVNGTAWDDSRLGSLWMTTPTVTDPICVATYSGGTWTKVTTGWPTNWLDFSAEDTKAPSQSGHEVSWKFTINMTPYGVASNQAVQVTAKDASSAGVNTSLSSTTQTVSNEQTPYYLMDFVPYIKGISGAYRSRLGRYPVQAGSSIVIEGYNFASSATYAVNFYKTVDGKQGGTAAAYSGTITPATGGSAITITAPQYSCFVEVTVSGTKTQNNTNTNERYNVQAGDYTVGDATPGANYWNDDCYISVWNVGTTFDQSSNPINGTIEKIMTGDIKYVNNEYLNMTWANNTVYGVWGSDANMVWDNALGKSRAYSTMGSSDGYLKNSPAEIETCVVNGHVFYGILDNTIVNSGTFGPGLILLRDGRKLLAADDSTYEYTVELIKPDAMKYQFQNPKIAGYYGTSSDTSKSAESYKMYISYYDAYSRCLKYGEIEYTSDMKDNQQDLIARNTTVSATSLGQYVVDGYDSTRNDYLSWDVGMWSDIKVREVSGAPYPVIAYYDKGAGKLKIARGASSVPTTTKAQTFVTNTENNVTTVISHSESTGDENAWTYTTVTSPSGAADFGRYVSMEMDSTGGLHIVAQDATNGILYYGYFTESGSSYTQSGNWQKVDATSSVGRWTDIKLEDSTQTGLLCKPVITYMDAANLNTVRAVKIAFIESATSATSGTWEAMTDPAEYESNDEKLSLIVTALDQSSITNRYAIGINSTMFALDFLRGEQ